jgi:hypothetical protein
VIQCHSGFQRQGGAASHAALLSNIQLTLQWQFIDGIVEISKNEINAFFLRRPRCIERI